MAAISTDRKPPQQTVQTERRRFCLQFNGSHHAPEVAMHMWKPSAIKHVLLWLLWQALGQARQTAFDRKNQDQAGRPKANTRDTRCTRRRSCTSIHRCTAAAIFLAVAITSFAGSQFPVQCTDHGTSPKVTENTAASQGQQDRQDRFQDRTPGSSIDRYHRAMAQVRTRHATDCTERTSQVRGFPSSCAIRADPIETGASWTFDSGARTYLTSQGSAASTDSTSHGTTSSTGIKCACQFRYSHTFHASCHSGAYGHRCQPSTSCTSTSRSFTDTCQQHGQQLHARNTCAIKLSHVASVQFRNQWQFAHSNAHAGSTCHAVNHEGRWTQPEHTTRQLGMATQATSDSEHAPAIYRTCRKLCGRDPAAAEWSPPRTESMPCHPRASGCQAKCTTSAAIFAASNRQPRSDRSWIYECNSASRTGLERPSNRSRRCWGFRPPREAPTPVDPICQHAKAMPRPAVTIPGPDDTCRKGRATNYLGSRHDDHAAWHSHRTPSSLESYGASGTKPTWSSSRSFSSPGPESTSSGKHAYDSCCSTRHHVHSQFTCASSLSPADKHARKISDVTSGTATTEDLQSAARQCSCPARSCCCSTDPTISVRWPHTHACSNRDSHRLRRGREQDQCRERVGLVTCDEHDGSHALYADSQRATTKQELPPLPVEERLQVPLPLNLDALIPMSHQETSMHQAKDLYQQLSTPWPDSAMLWGHNFVDMLPDLDPTIRSMVQSCTEWKGEHVECVHVYIDGSSYQNRQMPTESQAAWAFIVVLQCRIANNECSRILGATSHRLSHSNMNASEYFGVGELTMDALSAEAAGMINALSWISQSPFTCKHVVHYDNATIGQFSAGSTQWNADWEHSQLKQNLASLRHCLQKKGLPVEYQHVKAHEGHPMNECADALAKSTAKGILLSMPIPVWISKIMHHRNFKFAWMALAPPAEVPLPYALHGLFKAEGPCTKAVPDTTWRHPGFETTTQDVHIRITASTANVLTLAVGPKATQTRGLMQKGRIHTLQTQFQHAKTHIVGIQESRTQQQITRHNCDYLVYQSGAAPDGSRGCELWLDRSMPYATSKQSKLYFQDSHVHVARADDRCLLAVVRAPHLQLRVLVIHAPHQAAKDVQCEDWWNQLQHTVQHTAAHFPLIVLGDMNAKLGTIPSESVDTHGAEIENFTGHLLHSFMLECRLWAPATHSTNHEGPTHTWISCDGTKHRLDFVLLPMEWKRLNVCSFVQQDVDLCTVKDDHLAAAVTVAMRNPASTSRQIQRFRLDTRKCQDPKAQQAFLQHLATPPAIPWEVGVGLHAEVLTKWLQDGAQQFFHRSRAQPKQKYMSELTWSIVLMRKELLKLMRHAEKHVCAIELAIWFHQWKSASQAAKQPLQHGVHSHTRLFILLKLQGRCSHVFAWALHHRRTLHTAARHASRADRIRVAQQTVEQFLQEAQGHKSKALYRKLQPLLGQIHRKSMSPFRPIPAVKMPDESLATDHDAAAERWRTHFADAEQGTPTTVQKMQSQAAQEQSPNHSNDIAFDFQAVPTLDSIESYIRRSKTGKSPGVDGLPSEIYRLAPGRMAAILWPLLAKCSIRCHEPLRWKGGEICALPKKPQAGQRVEHFRSILLADYMSKIHHGLMRQRLLPPMQAYSHCMQAGGLPRLGTDMLHLYIQSFAQYTRHHGVSSACLFVDIKQAFYRASRHLLIQREVHESTIVQLFASQGWSPDMYRDFRSRIQEPPALAQANVSKHQMAQVDNLLTHTWFQIRDNPQTLTQTGCGTRPGDSIADLLFTYIMGRYIHALRERFVHHGLANEFELHWMPFGPLQPGDVDKQQLIEACWVDDLVLILQSATPGTLIRKIQVAIQLTQDLAVEFGLALNYGPDKTAVLCATRGPQAQAVKKLLFAHNPDCPKIEFHCQSLEGPQYLDVVPNYVYLGQLQDQQGHPGCEIKRRFLLIQPTSRLLQKNIFKSPRMPMKTRRQLFQSLVMSKLVYGAGAWPMLHVQTARSWRSQMLNLFAKIVARVTPGPSHYHMDTLATCELPHPMMILAFQRFRLMDRICHTDMGELFSLLQHQSPHDGWFALILNDLHRLSQTLPTHEVFGVASNQDAAELAHYCLQHPKALCNVTKWATKHYIAQLSLWKAFRKFQLLFEDDATQYGFDWTLQQHEQPAPAHYECPTCQATFPTYKALCTHTYKKHSELNVVHKYAITNVCRSCLKVYHSRTQLVHHLKYMRTGCLVHLIAAVPPLSDADQEEVMQEHLEQQQAQKRRARETRHKLPMMQGHGPRRPWPWQKANQFQHSDLRQCTFDEPAASWYTEVLQACEQMDVAETFAILQQHPYHGQIASSLTHVFSQHAFLDQIHQTNAYSALQEAVLMWQHDACLVPHGPFLAVHASHTRQMLSSIRVHSLPQPSHDMPVHVRRHVLIDQLWQDDSVHSQIRQLLYRERSKVYRSSPDVQATPPPCVQDPIFLYIFSGRRRQGDFQSHLEHFMHQRNIPGRVLMVDLALSDRHDVGNDHLEQMLIRWIRSGYVSGLLIAPPCETWSEARHLDCAEPGHPRPLRSALDPFGLPQLRLSEVAQLGISSFLLYVTIRLLFAAAVTRVPAIVEHPAEPRKGSRASIWKLPWFQFFEQMGFMTRQRIWQAEYGGVALKPTDLGVFHIDDFKAKMRPFRSVPNWSELIQLGGRDSSGAWRTSAAKEYPPTLNMAFAHVIGSQHLANSRSVPEPKMLPQAAIDEFLHLYAGDVDLNQQVIQPDYHRSGAVINSMD